MSIVISFGLAWAAMGLALRIAARGRKDRASTGFSALILVYACPLAMSALSGSALAAWTPARALLQVQALPFLFGPALYLYCRGILGREGPGPRRLLLHALPFLALNAVELAFPGLVSRRGGPGGQEGAMAAIAAATIGLGNSASVLAYGMATLGLARRQEREAGGFYSSGQGRYTLSWLSRLTIAYLVSFGSSIALLAVQPFLRLPFLAGGPETAIDASIALFLFFFSLYAHAQPVLARLAEAEPATLPAGKDVEGKYRNSALSERETRALFERLEALMESGRPYLDPDLTLDGLASLAGAGRHDLSRAINELSGGSFYAYVNGYRARAFLRALAEGRHRAMPFLDLALDCGFNSQSSFYAAVRKTTGKTPKELARSTS